MVATWCPPRIFHNFVIITVTKCILRMAAEWVAFVRGGGIELMTDILSAHREAGTVGLWMKHRGREKKMLIFWSSSSNHLFIAVNGVLSCIKKYSLRDQCIYLQLSDYIQLFCKLLHCWLGWYNDTILHYSTTPSTHPCHTMNRGVRVH